MTSPPLRRRTSSALITVSAIAAFLYANFLIDWVLRGFSGMGDVVSELEAPGEPNAVLLRVTDVVCAVLVVSLLPWVRGGLRPGCGARSSSGRPSSSPLGAAGAAIVATPCGPSVACDDPDLQLQLHIHDLSSIVSDTALYVGVAARLAGHPGRWAGVVQQERLLEFLARRRGLERGVRVLHPQPGPGLGGRRQPAGPHPVHQRLDPLPRCLRRHRGCTDHPETGAVRRRTPSRLHLRSSKIAQRETEVRMSEPGPAPAPRGPADERWPDRFAAVMLVATSFVTVVALVPPWRDYFRTSDDLRVAADHPDRAQPGLRRPAAR